MFIEIDYNKRPQKAKLHLAKPNKQIISIITEKFADSVSLKLGNINELEFSIPHYIEGERNKHVDLIKEKMLIKLTLGTHQEWYVVETIEESSDDSDVFTVTAFSLGYELRRKRVTELSEESINARELLTKLLEHSVWSVGEIDPIFEAMFRTFEISDSNILDAIVQAVETYGALIVWDTLNRKVSFKDVRKNGKFRGMTVNYGKFLRSIKRTRTADEMVTRLHIEGNEGLTIHAVNPTGMGYIEDFSYFMYPFERDELGNVIKSSHFMSDELCIAIIEHKEKVELHTPEINSLVDAKIAKELELFNVESQLSTLYLELENVLTLLDTAQATGDTTLIAQRKQERDAKNSEIEILEAQKANLESEISSLQSQIDVKQAEIAHDTNFTPQLLDELDLFIIEKTWRDDRYTDVQELYDDGLKKFEELQQPKVIIDVSIDNLLNIVEEQYYWDKLVLGDLIKVKYPQMNIEYMAKIIEINYDLEAGEANLVIANTTDLLNETEKMVQLLYSNSSAASLIQNNKYKWDKVNDVEREVSAIISQEWDANKNKITAGVNNTIEVGNRGIIIKNPDFPEEVVIMQSGIIALSKDGGETWKTAVKPDGIVAERLIGQIIAGQELIITNSKGSFTLDNNGAEFNVESFVIRSGSGENMVDEWTSSSGFVKDFTDDGVITSYEKRRLSEEWKKIDARYNSQVIRLNGYYDDQGMSIADVVLFHDYYDDLYNYLFVTVQADGFPLLSQTNINKTTSINRSTFETKFNNFINKETKVDEILDLRAKELADNAQSTADEAKRNIAEVEDDVVYKIEIHSSKGFTFRNGIIDTVATARVYRGKDNITSTIPASGFIWKKFDKDGVLDQSWTDAHVGVGNVIHITSNDVNQKAIFSCDIDIV